MNQRKSQNIYSDAGMQEYSMSYTKSDLYNENQMLAELIQKKAIVKQQHKASLPINKLMVGVRGKKNMRNVKQHFNTYSKGDGPIQSLESVYQTSQIMQRQGQKQQFSVNKS